MDQKPVKPKNNQKYIKEEGGDWVEDFALNTKKSQIKNKHSDSDNKDPTIKRRKVTNTR